MLAVLYFPCTKYTVTVYFLQLHPCSSVIRHFNSFNSFTHIVPPKRIIATGNKLSNLDIIVKPIFDLIKLLSMTDAIMTLWTAFRSFTLSMIMDAPFCIFQVESKSTISALCFMSDHRSLTAFTECYRVLGFS